MVIPGGAPATDQENGVVPLVAVNIAEVAHVPISVIGSKMAGPAMEGGEFTINIDPAWKIVTPGDFYAEIPKETIVAFTTPEAYDGFYINVNIIKEDLKQEVSAIDYARANINVSAQNLTDYTKVQEAKIDLAGAPTLIHIFQARLNPSEKLIRFVQLYTTKGKFGYIVTGGMLPSTPKNMRDKVGATVTSFKLR